MPAAPYVLHFLQVQRLDLVELELYMLNRMLEVFFK